jgi:8-oxo-dGTP pyrophosphatase MutT (NUDIX family)
MDERPITIPRLAATVILLRTLDGPPELLLVQRSHEARFMGGAWVFPGGAVDDADRVDDPPSGDRPAGVRAAARRELFEEASVRLEDLDDLVPYARWITPRVLPIRFDTWFFLAAAPADAAPAVDNSEIVDWRWSSPQAALADESLTIAFPTRRQLEQLATFSSAQALLDHARASTVEPIEPRLIEGERARIVLPGDAEFPLTDAPEVPEAP